MASTPFFFFSGLLFLAWFTADVHSVKVLPDVLKGSSVVLRPVEAVTSITTITWKHGDNLAAEWLGGNLFFYNIFNNTCSLNTETGELTINNVRPEHSGVYTPDINGKTRSALKLRVLYPVPKPSISHDCYPGETPNCTIRCMHTYTPENVGHMEVFWILDDSRVNGSELQITEDTKTETFICSLKNSVSSKNSAKLLNPLLPSVPVWKPVVWTLVPLASIALLAFVCWKWIYLKHKLWRIRRIIREIQETMLVTEHERITEDLYATESVTELEITLLKVDGVILRILREGNKRNLSEDSILMLLTGRYVILRILKQRHEVQNSLDKVKKIIEKFFKGKYDSKLSEDEVKTLQNVHRMIWGILNKTKELKLYKDEEETLQNVNWRILRILREKKKPKVSEDELSPLNEEDQKLKDVDEGIEWILSMKEDLKLSREEKIALRDVHSRISTMIFNMKERRVDEGSAAGGGVDQPEEDLTLLKVDKMISRILNMKKELKLSYEEKIILKHVQRTLSTVIIKKEDEEDERRRLNASDPAAEPLI